MSAAALGGLVGPNAVIQTGAALTALVGRDAAARVFATAGHPEWLDAPPDGMTPGRSVAALFDALRAACPAEWRAVASQSGALTGAYILANRIPPFARWLIRAAPRRLGARFLTAAIVRHAWTFAGGARVEAQHGDPIRITIHANPLAQPDCPWHTAVFTTLYRALVAPDIDVRHTACIGRGDACCAFAIDLYRSAKK